MAIWINIFRIVRSGSTICLNGMTFSVFTVRYAGPLSRTEIAMNVNKMIWGAKPSRGLDAVDEPPRRRDQSKKSLYIQREGNEQNKALRPNIIEINCFQIVLRLFFSISHVLRPSGKASWREEDIWRSWIWPSIVSSRPDSRTEKEGRKPPFSSKALGTERQN